VWQTTFDETALGDLGCFPERVLLTTCNRWDLVVVLPSGMSVSEARSLLTPPGQRLKPYAYVGEGALEQLTRVAASLDSLNPGEDQIMAQVRSAFSGAQAAGTTGPLTSFAFHTALRVAKRVRREVALAPLNTSLFSLARPELERHLLEGGRVAVLGAGEMGALAAKTLACQKGVELIVVNRSVERARQLAKHLGVKSSSLEAFLAAPPEVDALVCATPVRGLIDDAALRLLPKVKVVVDLGVPRNVQTTRQDLVILDVDSLQAAGQVRREAMNGKLAQAEALVQEEVGAAMEVWTERQLGPSIQKLREMYLAAIGDALSEEEARRLAHKFAHVPIKGLRAVARAYGLEAAQTFLAEAGLRD